MLRASSEISPAGATDEGLVLAGERAADVVAFERQIVAFFVDAADLLGVPKSVAAIYGIIFASPEPLSFGEVEARLDISKGSISQGLRVLREVGAIRVSEVLVADEGDPVSGSTADNQEPPANNGARSRDRYEPDLQLRRLVARFLESRVEKQLAAGEGRLAVLRESLPAIEPEAAGRLEKRLNSLSDWHDKTSSLLPFVRTFLKLGA